MPFNQSRVISEVNLVAMAWARDHAGERLGTKWYDGEASKEPSEKWPVSESVRLAIRQIVTEAFSHEGPIRELAERIRVAGGFTKEQAWIVAETEVKFAMSHGNLGAWKRTDVVTKVKWLKSGLHKGRECCDLNSEAGAVPIGEAFPSGDVAPPTHIVCYCTLSIAEIIDPTKKRN